MTEAARKTGTTGSSAEQGRDRFSRRFRNILLVGSLCLLLLGGAGFVYLRAKSPLTLFSGSRRSIAAASAFIPKKAPFAFSLLTKPDELIDLQQALVRPAWRAQARNEIAQIQQNFLKATGLSYERDVQPWLGSEITFACTDLDLDQDLSNGEQPGYLLAFEIAPDQLPSAKSFLQLYWQQQTLAGNPANVQKVNGIRILSGRSSGITTASALVGEQFVMFANDANVLRRSFQSAQTAQNLAQSANYRRQVDELPAERIGLAYFDAKMLASGSLSKTSDSFSTPDNRLDLGDSGLADADLSASKFVPSQFVPAKFVAMSLGLTRNGLILNTGNARNFNDGFTVGSTSAVRRDLLRYLPMASELAMVGKDFSQLPSAGLAASLVSSGASDSVSDSWLTFLRSQKRLWSDVSYALAKLGSGRSSDWILATKSNEMLTNELDGAAAMAGYSVVPVEIGEETATAWTRFKTSPNLQTGRQVGLETEVLGLHLQQDDVDLFTNSISAMKSALSASQTAPQNSLLASPQFTQATAAFPETRNNIVFADWPAISSTIGRAFPALNQLQAVIRPWVTHLGAIAATFDQDSTDIFIQLSEIGPNSRLASNRSDVGRARTRSAQPSTPTY